MLINCYYYAPHNHTLLAEHLDADLERMAGLGTDVVSLCVQESQLTDWHQRRLRNAVDRIHAHGMKAHAVPNRWAGLVAGWLDGFGRFPLENPDTLVRERDGTPRVQGAMVSCVNNPKVVEYIHASLTQMFELFDFDGLIWDEPHSGVCFCKYCTDLNPAPTDDWYHGRFACFIDRASRHAKSLRQDAVVSLFVQPHKGALLRALLNTEHVDYLGSDGHVRSAGHEMHCMKRTFFEAYDEFAPLLAAAGKKSFFLFEAQRHRDEDLQDYLENIDKAFDSPMDHLMYYFSAHEMSSANEQRFNEATWTCVRRVYERRLKTNADS